MPHPSYPPYFCSKCIFRDFCNFTIFIYICFDNIRDRTFRDLISICQLLNGFCSQAATLSDCSSG
jgi:hypothetical protein